MSATQKGKKGETEEHRYRINFWRGRINSACKKKFMLVCYVSVFCREDGFWSVFMRQSRSLLTRQNCKLFNFTVLKNKIKFLKKRDKKINCLDSRRKAAKRNDKNRRVPVQEFLRLRNLKLAQSGEDSSLLIRVLSRV